jgi:L-ascorbate metabolism protein UlaG (beta-lactamase superfamily)
MKTIRIVFKILIVNTLIITFMSQVYSQDNFVTDKIPAKGGDIEITFIGHGSLMIKFDNKFIQVDPYSALADYAIFPRADLILLTHHHGDHLDLKAIDKVVDSKTQFIVTEKCRNTLEKFPGVNVMRNGDKFEISGIEIMAVPAYNIQHKRESGGVFHPKGEGNGYVLDIGGKLIYIAGDTEDIPEMNELKGIDIAFLPMNLPYTMTPEMVANAARIIKPGILYPYHFGDTDTRKLIDLLKNEKEIEVRIRNMK